MGTCATCKWWNFAEHHDNFGFGICEGVDTTLLVFSTNTEMQITAVGLRYEEMEDIRLRTREDFGCTLHEKKDA